MHWVCLGLYNMLCSKVEANCVAWCYLGELLCVRHDSLQFFCQSMHVGILKLCEHDILKTVCGNFIKFTFYNLGAVGNNKLIRFWSQRSRSQWVVKNHLFKNASFQQGCTGPWFTVGDHLITVKMNLVIWSVLFLTWLNSRCSSP